ncbi:MAG TPA: hypothetical protein VFH27_12965 [Longimicrobiaceae bacterium]|nr:hypothetical protein [Longimicrobiaceae bacterium]
MENLTSLTQSEMETVNGGSSAFWNDFWDGVLVDLQDMANGFHDGIK